MAGCFSQFINKIQSRKSDAQLWLKRRVLVALVWALLFSFVPWTPPSLTSAVEQAFENAPQAAQWAEPLALSITGLTDEALSSLMGPTPVYAGTNITLTLSKRDDGPDVDGISAGPDPVAVGETLVYFIHITNTGNITATVYLTEILPSELSYVSSGATSQDGGADWVFRRLPGGIGAFFYAGEFLGWGKGLGPGKSAILYVQARVQQGLADGYMITNQGNDYYAVAEEEPGTPPEYGIDVQTTVRSPQLIITKTTDPTTPGVGELLTYTIIYTNNGVVDATGIVVTDTLDPNVTYESASPPPDAPGAVLVWSTLGDLGPTAQGEIELVVRVGSGLNNNDTLINQAEIGSDQGVSAGTGDVETVVKASTLRVSKSATPSPVRAGERITYTIVFTNDSDISVSEVYITDTLPSGVTNVTSDTVDATFNGQNGNAYSWFVASMSDGEVGTIELAVDAIQSPVAADGSTTMFNQLVITSPHANNAVPFSLYSEVIPAAADTVTILISPDEQTVNTDTDITLTLVDQYDNPVSDDDNYSVDLALSSAGPTFGPLPPISIANGQGSTTISSTVAGTFVVTASVNGTPSISDTALVTFTSDVVDHFIIGPIADHQAGENFTVYITAADQFNNTVTSFNGTAAIQDNTTPNTLQPSTVSFSGGIASGAVISITLARTNTEIVVGTDPLATNSNPFNITAAAPNTVTVTTGQVNIPVGENELATATVVDAYNNPVVTGIVTFSINSGATVNPVNSSLDVLGQATSNVSSTLIGPATIVVTAAGGIVGSANITFIAGCPNVVSVSVDSDLLQVGDQTTVTVDVEDQYGNKVNWASVTFAADDLGAGGFVPATAALDSNGTATSTLTSTLVGQKIITATVAEPGCPLVSGQALVTYTIGAVSEVTITMVPNPQEVSLNADLIALATDQYGNPVAGEVITFAASLADLGGGGLSALTGTTDASGEATVQISSTLIGGVDVTATLQSDPTILATHVVSFTSGPPRYITVTVDPLNVEAGVQATLIVTMTDAFGNPCAWQPVTFTVTGYGGVATFDPSRFADADSNGVATTLVSGSDLGTMTIAAQGNSPYSDTTTLNIVAGPLDDFLTNVLADVGAGVDFTLHITAVDALGQHRAETGTILLVDDTGTLQPGMVLLTGGYATVVLSITQAMVNDQIRLIWQLDTDISSTTNFFTVMPSAPATIDLEYEQEMASCIDQPITATVVDRFTNPVPGQVVTFSVASGTVDLVPPSTLTTDANGQAVIYVRSTQSGTASIDANLAGGIIATANITFGIGAPEGITLTASSDIVQAGDSIVLTATVEDCGGRPISGLSMASAFVPQYSTGAGVVSPTAGTTDGAGQYTFVFTGTQTGEAYLFVSFMDNGQIRTKQTIVTVIPGAPVTIALTADPASIVPEGRHSMLIAVVQDAYGNAVPGCDVVFERTMGPSVVFDPISRTATTDINGTASITLTSTAEEGVARIRAFAPLYGFDDTFDVTIRWFAAYLPLVPRNYPTGDLEVIQITSHKYNKPGETRTRYEVRVTIRNNGPDTISGFWVDLYLDPDGPITTNVLWHDVSRMGKAWYVSESLVPGATMVLSTNDPDTAPPGVPTRVYSTWPGYLVGSAPHELWAMVDSFGTMPYGTFDEPNEGNNILGPVPIP